MEAPEYFQSGFCQPFSSGDSKTSSGAAVNVADHFIVEELLDFSNDDGIIADPTFDSTDSSTLNGNNAVDSCNSSSLSAPTTLPNFISDVASRNLPDATFSSDLCVPSDDIAELEWLSNIGEESFSSEDLQKLQLISGMNSKGCRNDIQEVEAAISERERRELQLQEEEANNININNSVLFNSEVSVPAKARSKRSRGPPCNWTSRLLLVSPTPPTSSSSSSSSLPPKKPAKSSAPRKKDSSSSSGGDDAPSDARKCLHCATDKTPQWRTGPMGPKTLCNACGVRYKSGRLVPEYRPAASPTFVLTKHSNSHRKVLELRRQKEMMRAQQHHQHHHFMQQQQQHQNMIFDVSNGDDFLIHQHVGPDFRHLI